MDGRVGFGEMGKVMKRELSVLAVLLMGAVCIWTAGCKGGGNAGCSCRKNAVAQEGQATTKAAANVAEPEEQVLFDGTSLKGWKITDFAGKGEVLVKDGQLIMKEGNMFTGVNYTNPVPTVNYEVNFDACRLAGSDFFCGFTFPVSNSWCSLIVGGWGGGVVGISSINGADASENETTKYVTFNNGQWYHIRVRVTSKKIEAWIDNDKMVDVDWTDKKISCRPGEIEESRPFGIATWGTTGAIRDMTLRRLKAD